MKEYLVGNEKFVTICSVHNRIEDIVRLIVLTQFSEKNEENKKIIDQLKMVIDLARIAKEMGQNMEDGLKRNSNDFYFHDFYNFYKFIYSKDPYDDGD